MSTDVVDQRLHRYMAPDWAQGLPYVPKYRVQLAVPNTPIDNWAFPGIPEGFIVSLKRDDLTGCPLSGNKVRKLEFLFADAIHKGCSHVITCGLPHSNHCRAVAVAARQLGMESHLFFLSDVIKSGEEVDCHGNLLLERMCGANLYFAPRMAPYFDGLKPWIRQVIKNLKDQEDETCYEIPSGGSDRVGLFGYLNVFQELLEQGVCERFDDIVVACGSGGTVAGLALSNYLTGSRLRIHAVLVFDGIKYTEDHIKAAFQEMGIKDVNIDDIVDIIGGHFGQGYGRSTEAEKDFILEVSSTTGIFLDPVYTGKAMLGMLTEMRNNPGRFKGRRILFIHTGGLFGLFGGGLLEDNTRKRNKEQNTIHVYTQLENPPS